MKKIFLLLNSLFLLNACTTTSFNQVEVRKQILTEETREILYTLASDEMKGRDSKSGGYEKAANFVSAYFKEHNVQPFYPAYRDSLVTDSLVSYNIVGQIGDFSPEKKTVLIGAHLDHVGIRGIEGDTIYNGANDNATGSTAVLQVASYLAQHQWEQNIIIALFADEEKGLKGAYHLAERLKEEKVNLAYMVNFEMLGITLTTGANQVYMTGFERSNMEKEMNRISSNFVQFLPEAKELNLFKRSDNYAFHKAFGVPAHTLSTFDFKNYNFYHKAGDEAEKMEVDNMNQIIGTATYVIAQLLKQDTSISLYPEE
ncbi:MAG: M28 family metallopeptidase [Flavobacteriaceae bacterium]